MCQYKDIEVDYPVSEDKLGVVDALFTFLSPEDIYYVFNGDHINIRINRLDYFGFEEKVDNLKKKFDERDEGFRLLEAIKLAVDGVRSYGLEAGKRVYVGYNRERKVKDRKRKEKKRVRAFYAAGDDFPKKDNVLSADELDKIIIGDSEEVLKLYPDNCIDLVMTSPPYNFGLDYEDHEDGVYWERYFDKLFAVFEECIRVLKYCGRIVVNVQPLFSDYIPIHHIISNFFMQRKLIWKGEIIWDKHNWNCKYTAWGSWQSPSNPYFKYTWEFLEIFCKGDMRKAGRKEDIDISAEEFKKYVVAKWDVAPERNMKDFGHPAMFPEKLVEVVLKLFSFRNDVILDPFNGVGTTTVVAKKTGRHYIGIDISEAYCMKAEERLSNLALTGELFK